MISLDSVIEEFMKVPFENLTSKSEYNFFVSWQERKDQLVSESVFTVRIPYAAQPSKNKLWNAFILFVNPFVEIEYPPSGKYDINGDGRHQRHEGRILFYKSKNRKLYMHIVKMEKRVQEERGKRKNDFLKSKIGEFIK